MANAHLPKDAIDGQIVADVDGNIWAYDASTRTWICKGVIADPPVVTETSAGVITPEIYAQLQQIREAKADGVSFDRFKIAPAIDAYWYYLKSSNNTIKIQAESESQVRFEINKAKLIHLLSKISCTGERGLTGDRGLPGRDGKPGKPEEFHAAVVDGRTMYIDVPVATPLETAISLRLFKNGSHEYSADVQVSYLPDDAGVHQLTIFGDELEFDEGSSLALVDGRLVGQLVLKSFTWGFLGEWKFKASQKGRKGDKGDPGRDFWEVVKKEFVDDNLRATKAVISLRQGGEGTFYYWSEDLFRKVCVSRVGSPIVSACDIASLNPFGKPTNLPALGDRRRDGSIVWDKVLFAAVEHTINECKDVQSYKYNPLDLPIEKLILPSWVPTTACYTPRLWSKSGFKWWLNAATGSAEDVGWVDCKGDSKDLAYPWEIITPGQPDEACCQEDFFWCPNVNDAPCPIEGEGVIQPPRVEEEDPADCCECDCPILSEVTTGGYDFETITLLEGAVGDANGNVDPTLAEQCVSCDVSGNVQRYNLKVKVPSGLSGAVIVFSLKLDRSVCPDRPQTVLSPGNDPHSPILLPGTNCGPAVTLENCNPQWRVTATDGGTSGAVQTRSFPTEFEDESINPVNSVSQIRYVYQPMEAGEVDYRIDVNIDKLWCCLGYKLCVEVNPEGGGSCGMFVTLYNNVTNVPYSAGDQVPAGAIIGYSTPASPHMLGGKNLPGCEPNCLQSPPWNGVPVDEHIENGIMFIDYPIDTLRQAGDSELSDLQVVLKYRDKIYDGYNVRNLGPAIDASFLNVPVVGQRASADPPSDVVPQWSDPATIFWIRKVVDNPLSCQSLTEIQGDPNHTGDFYYLRDLACGLGNVPVKNMINPQAAEQYDIQSYVLHVGKNFVILVHDCVEIPPPTPTPSPTPPPPSLSPSPTPSPSEPPSTPPSGEPSTEPTEEPSVDPTSDPSVGPTGSGPSIPCASFTEHTVTKSARALASVKDTMLVPCNVVGEMTDVEHAPCFDLNDFVEVSTSNNYVWEIPAQSACFAPDGDAAILRNAYTTRWLPPLLRATDFGFALPAGAIIKSISLRYRARVKAHGSNTSQLIGIPSYPILVTGGKRMDTLPGHDNFGTDWSYTPPLFSDLHKDLDTPFDAQVYPDGPPWTASELNAVSFGVDISINGHTTPVDIYVDHVEMTVKYAVCANLSTAAWMASLLNKIN